MVRTRWVQSDGLECVDVSEGVKIVTPTALGVEVGVVVIIDVLRAFTTSAFAFAAGAIEISLASSTREAFELRELLGDGVKLMGEEGGTAVSGFDAGNSPCEFMDARVSPRWIQRTSAGTRAATAATGAEHLIVASMVCAGATVRYIKSLSPSRVALVVSGERDHFDGADDRACAEFLAAQLRGETPEPAPIIDRIPTIASRR